MIFRQLLDPLSWTFTYLIADETTKEAILIDPVFEQARRDCALLDELGLTLAYTLDTHVHADHVTSAWVLREKLGAKIALMAAAGAHGADVELADREILKVGALEIEARATPGHTGGCGTYVLAEKAMAFTGDCLLIRGCGRTDFQEGSPSTMYRSIHEQIFTLPDSYALYPGHDYAGRMMTTVAEERAHNLRCGGERSEGDFVGLMETLGLPHPKQIDVAVPANMRCGEPSDKRPIPAEPSWAPLRYSYAGVWQVACEWLLEHQGEVQIVDVRPLEELSGGLGTIEGATLLPLDNVVEAAEALNRADAIVVVCRSGGRSAQATAKLMKAGFPRVANLRGGALQWLARGGALVPEAASLRAAR